MSNKAKFKVGDNVRVINEDHKDFDDVGVITELVSSISGLSYEVAFSNWHRPRISEHHLTLADPDVHEVLAEMAEQSGLAAEEKTEPLAYWALQLASGRRSVILRTAGNLITGQRAKDYGDAGANFQRIANLWSPILGKDVTPEQVALCMAQVKIARLITSPAHEDSWIDLAGYAALGGEIASTDA